MMPVLQVPRLPLLLPYLLTNQKAVILQDVRRWREQRGIAEPSLLACMFRLLCEIPEFRSLYYYRVHQGNLGARAANKIDGIVYRPRESLYIHATEGIGPGFYIEHGFSTLIAAKRIGANGYITQQVTIGYRGDSVGHPVIGNNVMIGAGAKIIGGITVGDNVMIGANAVVLKNVPSNCVVVGVPAYIVKRDGVRVRENL